MPSRTPDFLVCSDIDGTMLRWNAKAPTPGVVEAARRLYACGGALVPVTSNSAPLMQELAAQLRLRDMGVLDGGATIFDFATGARNLEFSRWLEPMTVRRVVRAIGPLCTKIYYDEASQEHTPDTIDLAAIQQPSPSVFSVHPIGHDERIHALLGAIPDISLHPNAYEDTTTHRVVQVVCKGVSKQSGVRLLLDIPYAGVSAENILFIGDSKNDFDGAPVGAVRAAMGNADPELRSRANSIVPHVDDDGWAVAVNTFIGE